MTNFSKNLRNCRKELGLSQSELAKEMCLADTSISAYELEKNEPSIDTLIKLSKMFKMSVDEMIGSDYEKNLAPETKELRHLVTLLNKEYVIQTIFYVKSLLQYQNKR